ncbi:hypothetical protein PAEPH01_0378 [Pancytospora epiphaga]|nr:hypothetical protein PAEPH01_0378 [Pancytospora epiphaga]
MLLLTIIFAILNWMVQVNAVNEKVILQFTDQYKIEYNVTKKVVCTSIFITNCRHFKAISSMKTESNLVVMDCSLSTFNIIDMLIDEKNTVNWGVIANECTLTVIHKLFKALEYLQYEDNAMNIIHDRLLGLILPKIVYSITNKQQKSNYTENTKECTSIEYRKHIGLIFTLFLRKHNLGIYIDEDIATICRDPENKYLKKISELTEFSELKILPETLNNDIKENQKLGIMLWMFDELLYVSELNLSSCILTDEHIKQLSGMKCLKTLNLSECTLKLDNNYNKYEIWFEALEEINISGVRLTKRTADILCRINNLTKLKMENCYIQPDINFEFIRNQVNLKELKIGKNNLSENQLDIIFSHKGIKILDMETCTVEEMYICGGKIESLELLKALNNCNMYVKEGMLRIILSVINNNSYLERLKVYNGRLLYFGDDSEMKIIQQSFTLFGKTFNKFREFNGKNVKMKEFNGSQVFFNNDKMEIILPRGSNISKRFKKPIFCNVKICFSGDGKMNFVEESKISDFMKGVEEYSCDRVYFEDKQMEMILSHVGLKKLNLRQCGLESEMVMKLKESVGLEELDVSNNNMIGEDDMVHIIRKCPKLKRLNMNRCRMLIKNTFKDVPILENLEELNMGGNKLNSECCEYVFKHVKLSKLEISGCGLVKNSLKGINNLEGLKELHIGENFINKSDFDEIFKLKNLEDLRMPISRLFEEKYDENINIDSIKELSMLKTLDISNNGLLYVNIDGIFELVNLENLNLKNCKLFLGKLQNINKLNNLVTLNIRGNTISKVDMDAISELKMLKNLKMCNCGLGREQVFENIGRLNGSLILFDVERCLLFEDDVQKLKMLTNLQDLRLTDFVNFEVLYDILNSLPCLKVLHLSACNTREFITLKVTPLQSFYTLEILKLECFHMSNEFVRGLSKLMNLREFTLKCIKSCDSNEIPSFDISVFPRTLRKLTILGECELPIELFIGSESNDKKVFENLEELCLFNIDKISKDVIKKIASCKKLKKLKIQMNSCVLFIDELKELERIITLEELILDQVDLSNGDEIELSSLRYLRRLRLLNCKLNGKYLNEIERLKSLEALNIAGNKIYHAINGIVILKNLRELYVDNVLFDCDKGGFRLIKGFERLEYNEWDVYKNNKCITWNNANFTDLVTEMKNEATLNNWKGVTSLNSWCVVVNSALFLAVSSKLIFIDSIILHLCDKLKKHKYSREILENCLMLREIRWVYCDRGKYLPLSSAVNIISDKPLLQVIEMPISDLSIEFSNTLTRCRHLHTIKLHVQKYRDGFLATLFKESGMSAMKFVKIFFGPKSWCHLDGHFSEFTENANTEGIIKYIRKEDADAIAEAKENGVHLNIRFFIN